MRGRWGCGTGAGWGPGTGRGSGGDAGAGQPVLLRGSAGTVLGVSPWLTSSVPNTVIYIYANDGTTCRGAAGVPGGGVAPCPGRGDGRTWRAG